MVTLDGSACNRDDKMTLISTNSGALCHRIAREYVLIVKSTYLPNGCVGGWGVGWGGGNYDQDNR